jgi:hypothetical protein
VGVRNLTAFVCVACAQIMGTGVRCTMCGSTWLCSQGLELTNESGGSAAVE